MVSAGLGIRHAWHRLLREGDDDLIRRRLADPLTKRLDAAIADAGPVDRLAYAVRRRRRVKLHIDQRAALEVDPQWNVAPEKDGQQASHAEDEGEAEEIPLLPQPVDLYVVKQFHLNIRLPRTLANF